MLILFGVIPAQAGIHPMDEKQPCVYMLASKRYGTLYTGVTSSLRSRIYEHKADLVDGFTKKYQVHDLVYFEFHETMLGAIGREKQIKKWARAWKIRLLQKDNPGWRDLYAELF